MKARIKDNGVLFKTSQYSESSLILKAFTRERGLISIIAKGIRKKPEASLLCPLYDYEFTLYEPQDSGLYLLVEFCIAQEYDLSGKVESWSAAQCALELYSQLLIPSEENPHYYELLHLFLGYLSSLEGRAILIWWRFLLRVLKMLGIPFDPEFCQLCQQRAQRIAAYEKGSVKLTCHECFEPSSDQERFVLLTSQNAVLLPFLPKIGNHLQTIEPDGESVKQLNQLFADYYFAHFGRRLKLRSLEVLEQFYT